MRCTTHPWFDLGRHDGAGDGGQGGNDGGGGDPSGQPADRTFTQTDLDRIVTERLARERAKYADHDDLKAKAAELDQIKADQQTEAERLAADRDAALQRADAAVTRAVRAEVKALADGFADRDDAVLNLGDLGRYVTDGEVDTEAIGVALAEVLHRKPHLARPAAAGPRTPAPDQSQGRGGTTTAADYRQADEAAYATELARYGLRPYGR
ncbi:MAG: DUF4355 domain-containing protein [Micromonosporaceae bacterium]|nr:DUF4355 domain-containing protein [Micromonosporaceae bacterium]